MYKVSIICVTFNSAETLLKTIESVSFQKFTNYEFIIIDGGSTDGTIEIIKDNLNVITNYISEPDKGIFDAMNKGVSLATGEWLYFIGSDDYFASNNVLEVFFNSEIDESIGVLLGDVKYDNGKIFHSHLNWKILLYCSIHHQGTFYRKKIFDNFIYQIEPYFPSDYDLNITLYLNHIKYLKKNIIVTIYALGGESSNIIWKRYRMEILARNKHINFFILRWILALQTTFRFIIKKIFLFFNIVVHI